MDIQNHYNSIIDLSKQNEFKDFNYKNICNYTQKTLVTLKNDDVTVNKSNYKIQIDNNYVLAIKTNQTLTLKCDSLIIQKGGILMLYQEQEQYDNLKKLMEEKIMGLIDDDETQKIFNSMRKFYADSALLTINGKIENYGQIYLNGRIRDSNIPSFNPENLSYTIDPIIVSGNGKIINYDIGPSPGGYDIKLDTFNNYINVWRYNFKEMSTIPFIIPTVSKSMWTINIKNTTNTITSVYDKYEVAKENNQTDNKGKKWQWSDLEPLTYLSTFPWALLTRKKPINMC
jgi:hypothetical protein